MDSACSVDLEWWMLEEKIFPENWDKEVRKLNLTKCAPKFINFQNWFQKHFNLMHQTDLISQFVWIVLNHRYKVEASWNSDDRTLPIYFCSGPSDALSNTFPADGPVGRQRGCELMDMRSWSSTPMKSGEHLYLSFSCG